MKKEDYLNIFEKGRGPQYLKKYCNQKQLKTAPGNLVFHKNFRNNIDQHVNLKIFLSKKEWTEYRYVIFPNLNVFPSQTDSEFGVTVENLFRYLSIYDVFLNYKNIEVLY